MDSGQGYQERSVDDLIRKIANNDPNCDRAYFDDVRISPVQLEALAKAIEKNGHLTYINLNTPYLNAKQLQRIKEALEKNQSISEVILAAKVSDEPYQAIYDEIMAKYSDNNSCRPAIQQCR